MNPSVLGWLPGSWIQHPGEKPPPLACSSLQWLRWKNPSGARTQSRQLRETQKEWSPKARGKAVVALNPGTGGGGEGQTSELIRSKGQRPGDQLGRRRC